MLVLNNLHTFPKILPVPTLEVYKIMILKRLKIKGFGPFFEEQTLDIEPDVTVLTGANDVGKSTLLTIIDRVPPTNDAIYVAKADVNEGMISLSGVPWNKVSDLDVIATYQLSAESNLPELCGGELDTRWPAGVHGVNLSAVRDSSGNEVDLEGYRPQSYSRVINLGITDRIKPVLDQETTLPIERALLEFAFDSNDVWNELASLPRRVQNQRRDQANNKLKTGLASYKPESLQVELSLDFESRNPVKFVVDVLDRYGGFAGPDLRGEGYQKLLALMFYLRIVQPAGNQYVILLLDEPENSLHADAQHSFRRVLESFAESPLIQVVYATHSPAMINPARPKSLRLLTREKIADDVATTRINNKPYADDNYQLIRSSLGITPADSLLYAPITIIIEGATESLGLNRVFQKLITEGDEDKYSDLEGLLGQIHFLPAGGSKYDRWAKMAHSQGAKPIIFVDGDQISRVKTIKRKFPDIPIIHFDETKEFEDIVPREVYFEALTAYAASNNPHEPKIVSKEVFTAWEAEQEFDERVPFSKRVSKWYEELFEYDIEKAEVMDSAIERAKLEDIDMSKIDELIDAIREAAENLH